MIRTVLLGALLCVLLQPAAHACDVMRPCYGNGRLIYSEVTGQAAKLAQYRHHPKPLKRLSNKSEGDDFVSDPPSRRGRVPPGLRRVMAEGAGRAVNWI